MLEVSWTEIAVLIGAGIVLTGRKDLPMVSRNVGHQLGRVVGLLQGARARADQFAQQNELRQLQNELRSGLRELDQVKTELAVAASSGGMLGRGLGATVASANRNQSSSSSRKLPFNTTTNVSDSRPSSSVPSSSSTTMAPVSSSSSSLPPLPTTTTVFSSTMTVPFTNDMLSPAIQSERAAIEEEWENRGIGFKSIAEQGLWMGGGRTSGNNSSSSSSSSSSSRSTANCTTGSELLESMIRETLIFDQYDRVQGKQEAEMQERIQNFREKKRQADDDAKKSSKNR